MKTIDFVKLRECFRLNDDMQIERKNKASGKWKVVKNKNNFRSGYCQIAFNGTMCFYHRLVWCLYYGKDIEEGFVIDHIDGNKLNNNISNLRQATISQNAFNSKKRGNKSTIYKGVSRSKGRTRYRAYIQENKKQHYLGSYKTQYQAYSAYCEASKKYHGEFGRTE
jgi:hypothetical protein